MRRVLLLAAALVPSGCGCMAGYDFRSYGFEYRFYKAPQVFVELPANVQVDLQAQQQTALAPLLLGAPPNGNGCNGGYRVAPEKTPPPPARKRMLPTPDCDGPGAE